jgi:hypothetical protein
MKKKLKIEGEEKLKIELTIKFNEIIVTLFEGGFPTKFTKKIVVDGVGELFMSSFANSIEELYTNYTKEKEIEGQIVEMFKDKEYIEFRGTEPTNDFLKDAPYTT